MNQSPRPPSNRSTRPPARSRAHGATSRAAAAGRGFTSGAPTRSRPASSNRPAGGRTSERARTPRPRPVARRTSGDPGGSGVGQVRRWLPVGAAAALLAVVVGVGMANGDDGGGATPPPSVPASAAQAAPVPAVVPASSTTPDPVVTVATTAPIEKTTLSRTIHPGMGGDEVIAVQQRLVELGFDPGPADGWYGTLSQHAVWAFDKLVMGTPRDEVTGAVTAEMWSRMQDPIQVVPRSPSGGRADHVEIYLPEQVMIVFHSDAPALITHISTGELVPGATGFTPWYETAATYRETVTIDTDENGNILEEPIVKEVEGHSYTPPGVFTAYRMIEGRRQSALGGMYDPIYINQGIAIHGANNIPLHPDSHGCIRVSRYLGEKLQKDGLIEIGDKVLIWDGVTAPENQPPEARQMRWDRDVTSTTTTSTTIAPTTTTTAVAQSPVTLAPETTAATTTTVPATTTTTVPATTTTQPATTTTQAAPEPTPTPEPEPQPSSPPDEGSD